MNDTDYAQEQAELNDRARCEARDEAAMTQMGLELYNEIEKLRRTATFEYLEAVKDFNEDPSQAAWWYKVFTDNLGAALFQFTHNRGWVHKLPAFREVVQEGCIATTTLAEIFKLTPQQIIDAAHAE